MGSLEKLSQLTIQEKCSLCCSTDCIKFPGVPRLDIPAVNGIDGPQGVRMEDGRKATALPCNMALAATFDPETAFEYGRILAKECIANGFQIIFGPGINLMRTPMNGRNFEYMGEDPVLAGKIGAAYVRGCQSEAVAACPKHMALNNQEICRTDGNSICDWETIRNLYLEAFRIIVKEASPWCIMSSYNKVNGEYASQCGMLQQKILKDEWGFDGVVISDAGAVHDGKACFLNGLDIALADLSFRDDIPVLVENGEIPEEMLDEKVRRMLRLTDRTHAADPANCRIDQKSHAGFARNCAAESAVLLKNRENILPLDPAKRQRILITGPAADSYLCIGSLEKQGGSGAVHPPYEITPWAGLQANLTDFELTYLPCFRSEPDRLMDAEMLESMTIRYFDLASGELFFEENKLVTSIVFGPVNAGGVVGEHPTAGRKFRAELTGRIKAPRAMRGQFSVFDSRLNAKLRYKDSEIVSESRNLPFIELAAGETLDFTISFELRFIHYAELNLLWHEDDSAQIADLLRIAPEYDAVIYFGGRTHLQDKEAIGMGDVPNADIMQWELPAGQDDFLKKLCAVNSSVIGVFNTGSPFDLRSWHENIAAILISWYPGMENGNAVADILTGKSEPGGRLPFTWGADLMDYACHANGSYPGVRGEVDPHTNYLEGELIGYRYFDRSGKQPLYPFGGGMGYADFALTEAEFCNKNEIKITVSIKNSSSRSGSEVIHLYAGGRDESPTVPLKELVCFRKISAGPGETVKAVFSLSAEKIAGLQKRSFTKLLIGRNAAEVSWEFPLQTETL